MRRRKTMTLGRHNMIIRMSRWCTTVIAVVRHLQVSSIIISSLRDRDLMKQRQFTSARNQKTCCIHPGSTAKNRRRLTVDATSNVSILAITYHRWMQKQWNAVLFFIVMSISRICKFRLTQWGRRVWRQQRSATVTLRVDDVYSKGDERPLIYVFCIKGYFYTNGCNSA